MKIYRFIHSYSIKILKEEFQLSNGDILERTAKISFNDAHNNLIERRKYGVIDKEKLYELINSGKEIDVSNCYVKNFSLSDYKYKYKLSKEQKVDLKNFTAVQSLFESEKSVDFSNANFIGEKTDFSGTHFGSGNLSFYNSEFGDFPVSFINTSYSEGNSNFQYVKFNNGNVNFEDATFQNGDVSFVNSYFGDGFTNFKNIHFGNGDVNFRFSTFSKGNITFDKSVFNGGDINFSKIDFGEGKVDFRRVDFGDGDLDFQEIEVKGKQKIVFRRAKFGKRNTSFRDLHLNESSMDFDEAEFNNGKVDFFKAEVKSISFSKCLLSCYIDFRVDSCDTISLKQSIVQDIVDLNPGLSKMKLNKLNLSGVRNMGDIFISWDDNRVLDLICNQTDTSLHDKAEQFRLLKEEFRDTGRYTDEDKAYIYFKRFELKDHVESLKKESLIKRILYYPSYVFQKIIFDWMGLYATNPFRVIFSILVVNLLFAILYTFFMNDTNVISCISNELSITAKFFESLYFSAITFFTIGYGECVPLGFFKIIAPIQGFTGVFLMSYFTVAFVRKILR
ncbi:MAG: hypothetical protein CL846_02220 [Crocinitomicaceae bacterium]|nr:hypothetical protein [Crocinitomicaceae bacterium]